MRQIENLYDKRNGERLGHIFPTSSSNEAMNRLSIFDDHKIDFPLIDIPEISQFGVVPLRILTVETPFQKMAGNQVFEAQSPIGDDSPIEMVMLGLFIGEVHQ